VKGNVKMPSNISTSKYSKQCQYEVEVQ